MKNRKQILIVKRNLMSSWLNKRHLTFNSESVRHMTYGKCMSICLDIGHNTLHVELTRKNDIRNSGGNIDFARQTTFDIENSVC